jgi:hypothetical protein
MFKKISAYICFKIYKIGCLGGEVVGRSVPVLYIGRTVPKG